MIQEIKTQKLQWILVTNPTKKNLAYIWEHFPITNNELTITLPPLQRPRVEHHKDYTLAILQFPYYVRETHEIRSSELDIFIGKDFLVTVTDGKLKTLNDFFDTFHDRPQDIIRQAKNNTGSLLQALMNELLLAQFPMLNHISQDLDYIEEIILDDLPSHKGTIYEILGTKRNIVNFRRVIQSHKDIIKKIARTYPHFITLKKTQHFENLVSHTIEAWTILEGYKESIDALNETHESLLNFRTNQIIKTLTIFSVIVFPLTLLAAIFGMNTVFMPIVNHKQGFWIIVAIMLVGATGMYGYFKHRKWI